MRSCLYLLCLPALLLLSLVEGVSAQAVGEPAPHFTAKTLDGEKVSNETLRGKVVLLDFWATWCPACKHDEPALEALVNRWKKEGLVVLSVNMGEGRRKVKKYLDSSPRSSKVVLAEDTTLAAIYNAQAYPLYVLIDREGDVAGVQRGSGGPPALTRLLAKAGLAQESEDNNSTEIAAK